MSRIIDFILAKCSMALRIGMTVLLTRLFAGVVGLFTNATVGDLSSFGSTPA